MTNIIYIFALALFGICVQAGELQQKGYWASLQDWLKNKRDITSLHVKDEAQQVASKNAYNKDIKERAMSFYNRFKSALGFKSTESRTSIFEKKNSTDTQGSVDVVESVKPTQDFEIVKKENYLDGDFGIEQLVAKSGDKKIGEITYAPSECRIKHLSVNEEQRKRGAGSKLFKSAVNQMENCEEIRWWATPDSVPFYRKQGAKKDRYQETGIYQNMRLDKSGGRADIKRNYVDRPY